MSSRAAYLALILRAILADPRHLHGAADHRAKLAFPSQQSARDAVKCRSQNEILFAARSEIVQIDAYSNRQSSMVALLAVSVSANRNFNPPGAWSSCSYVGSSLSRTVHDSVAKSFHIQAGSRISNRIEPIYTFPRIIPT